MKINKIIVSFEIKKHSRGEYSLILNSLNMYKIFYCFITSFYYFKK